MKRGERTAPPYALTTGGAGKGRKATWVEKRKIGTKRKKKGGRRADPAPFVENRTKKGSIKNTRGAVAHTVN